MKDYYKILGLKEDASNDEIKKVFRNLAKKYHPDANPGNKRAEEQFKGINEAYEILGDAEKRKQYDTMRTASASGYDFSDFVNRGKRDNQKGSFSDFDFGDFGSIFGSMFGRGGKSSFNNTYQPEDLNYELTIPFEQAITGGQTTITVPIKTECPSCNGTGAKPGTAIKTCPNCSGKGSVSMAQGSFAFSQPCPKCLGKGTFISSPCHNCNGEGISTQYKKINVDIPPGVNDGAILRLSGQGPSASRNEPCGDINISIKIAPHHFFQRKGYDIYCEITINLAQAILGSRIKIKTINESVIVKIPPGTQNGAVLRVPEHGIVKPTGDYGDQYIKIKIDIPKKLNDAQKKLVEELAHLSNLKY